MWAASTVAAAAAAPAAGVCGSALSAFPNRRPFYGEPSAYGAPYVPEGSPREPAPPTNETSRRPDLGSARCAGKTFPPPRLPFPFPDTAHFCLAPQIRVLKIEIVHFSQPAFDNREVLSNA